MELAGRKDDVVPAVLRQELNALLIILINKLPEVLADDDFLDIESVLTDVGDLEEHRGGHVHGVERLTVNV